MSHIKFNDRQDALEKLLLAFSDRKLELNNSIILATSASGVFFADTLAASLKVPFDYIFCRPILAPLNSECQVAIVSEELDIVMNENIIDSFNISLDYIYGEAKRQYEENIIPARYKYRQGQALYNLKGKDAIIVDQGIDTGLTAMCAIKTCVHMSAKSVRAATPILPVEVLGQLNELCDEVLYVEAIENFVSTSHYYKKLEPVDDKAVEKILSSRLNVERSADSAV